MHDFVSEPLLPLLTDDRWPVTSDRLLLSRRPQQELFMKCKWEYVNLTRHSLSRCHAYRLQPFVTFTISTACYICLSSATTISWTLRTKISFSRLIVSMDIGHSCDVEVPSRWPHDNEIISAFCSNANNNNNFLRRRLWCVDPHCVDCLRMRVFIICCAWKWDEEFPLTDRCKWVFCLFGRCHSDCLLGYAYVTDMHKHYLLSAEDVRKRHSY